MVLFKWGLIGKIEKQKIYHFGKKIIKLLILLNFSGEKPSDHHFGKLDREWEVVTVRELCRRLSLEDSLEPSEMPLPEGASQSQLLDEFMLRQVRPN